MREFIETLIYSYLVGVVCVVFTIITFFLVCSIISAIQILTGAGL